MKLVSKLRVFDTYGRIAIASLFVCGLTGFFLIIPYDPVNAYLSVTSFVTSNPAASLSRNLHYWSAQFFLIFTILHFIDHLRSGIRIRLNHETKKGKLTRGIWLRLVLSLMVIFYVMISGFILKDDTDSRQAHMLLSSLLSSIPFLGEFLSSSFTGKPDSLMVVYLHHAATATIIVLIVIFEHVREIKVKWSTFGYTSLILLVISVFFRAPLTLPDESIMKGPWYFIGVQELLHLYSQPLIVIALILLILPIIYYIPFAKGRAGIFLKYTLWVMLIIYAVLSIIGYFFRGPYYSFQWPGESGYRLPVTLQYYPVSILNEEDFPLINLNGRIEGCMSCHKGMQGLSASHNPDLIGCYSCHGGDPFTLNANNAHKGMFQVPGNFSNSKATCGRSGCHQDITERIPQSMMATLTGIIAVDKWVFKETDSLNSIHNVNELKHSPADKHLRNLCAGCHLGMEKLTHGNSGWLDRGGGCNACHLTYNETDLQSLKRIKQLKSVGSIDELKQITHPKIDLNITNDKCESCHSRSGRISMSYAGWHETSIKELPSDDSNFRKLPDGRIFIKQPADVHHDAGLLCIDCHSSYELMGDGTVYSHKEQAVKISCEDCHLESPESNHQILSETDRESQLIAWLRGWDVINPRVILTKKDNQPLVNVWYDSRESKARMISKASGKSHPLKSPLPQCISDNAHKRLSCETCHTSWVPQCIGCHNAYEKETTGYDMLKRKTIKGTWVEYSSEAMAEAPVLGMRNTDKAEDQQQVGIFSPGMIMTIDHSAVSQNQGTDFHRLYAPVSGHTTQRTSRTCESCHLNPLALGFGRGTLELTKEGKWSFTPLYELNKNDHLPEDAWTGFLQDRHDQSATRMNMRPFNKKEQVRILQAGACLKCHDEKSMVIKRCLNDFNQALDQASQQCIIPR